MHVCIGNIYNREWDEHWTNPFNTHQRVYEHSDCVEVHIGHHQIRVSKKELIEFDRSKYGVCFISKSRYGNLFKNNDDTNIDYNTIQEIEMVDDESDEKCDITLITKDGKRAQYYCSYHSFYRCADIDFITNISSIIPTKVFWTDGGAEYKYVKTL